MQRTTIYLDDETHTKIKYAALDEHISMADLIRRAVDEFLKKRKTRRRRARK
jgi:Ribbon-helix-helix protein, copG family